MAHDHGPRAVVIGAGLSGLAAARALVLRGVRVSVLDERDRIAEPWRARHPQLRLNIHRHFAQLPGLPMPADDGIFVRRDAVVRYLERYAQTTGARLALGERVERVTRRGTGWRVSTSRGEHACEHVVVAMGRDRMPHVPDWPGRDGYTGVLRHAADLGDIAQYRGRDLLVIGAGNSGSDVLNHLARIETGRVRVSLRHGPAIVPTLLFGVPLHRLARLFAILPRRALDPAFAATQRIAFGDLRRHGLRSHPDGGGTRLLRDGIAFAVDDGFVAALKQGRFEIVAETVAFEGGDAVLADGRRLAPAVVIAATGYRSGLEPLFGAFGVLDARGLPRHPMGEPDRAHPGLWFTGYRPLFTGYFDAARVAAARIARHVAGGRRTRSSHETSVAASVN